MKMSVRTCCASILVGIIAAACSWREGPGQPQHPFATTPDETFRAAAPTPVPDHPLPLPVTRSFELENGLPVWVVQRPDLPFVVLEYANDAGVIHGREGVGGLTALAIAEGTREADGTVNHDVELDGTPPRVVLDDRGVMFAVTTAPEQLTGALTWLARLVQSPALDGQALATGANQLGASQSNRTLLVARTLRAAAELSGRGGREATETVGSPAPGSSTAPQAVRAFYGRHYGPHHGALIAVGAVDLASLRAEAARAFGGWRPPDESPRLAPSEGTPAAHPQRRGTPSLQIRGLNRPDGQARFTITFPCVSRAHPDEPVLDVMSLLLDQHLLSPLAAALGHSAAGTYGLRAGCYTESSSGSFVLYFDANPEAAREGLETVLLQIRRLRTTPVTDADLETAKRAYFARWARRMSSNGGLAQVLGREFMYGRPANDLERVKGEVDAIVPADILRVAARYLDDAYLGIAVMGRADVLSPQLNDLGLLTWD